MLGIFYPLYCFCKTIHFFKKIIYLSSDDQLIRRFLYSCRHSLERTKKTIDLCFTIRSQAPEIFSNRDPDSKEMENIYKTT